MDYIKQVGIEKPSYMIGEYHIKPADEFLSGKWEYLNKLPKFEFLRKDAPEIIRKKIVHNLHPYIWEHRTPHASIEIAESGFYFGLLDEKAIKPIVVKNVYPIFVRRYTVYLQWYSKLIGIPEIVNNEDLRTMICDYMVPATICYAIEEREYYISQILPTYGQNDYFKHTFLEVMGVGER